MRVVVTRPERDAQEWVQELELRGFQAVAIPLIAIAPARELEILQRSWQRMESRDALMFVSGNAVEQFFAARPADAMFPWDQADPPRAWATGPGTVAALRSAGVPAAYIDAPPVEGGQFDSETLWQKVSHRLRFGYKVLIVRGADASGKAAGRDWLAEQLKEAGAVVDVALAYERQPPVLTARQLSEARLAAHGDWVWVFSSSEAVANLRVVLRGQDWSQARAIATHARIVQAAREAGFGVVWQSRPTLDAVCASIESIA